MQQKFDVFLSFRGEDVRYNFLSHLIAALDQASLEIFVDYKIKRGDEINLALMSAIENSKLAITIFSENYATSRWCLNELVKIMECRENPRMRLIVIPVFYHVASADVKSQSGSFAKAFADHENSEYLVNRRNAPIWKVAMNKAINLSGRSVKEKSPEYDVVVDIVNDVLKALGRPPMENKVNDSSNSIKLIQTLELQVRGNIWTLSSSSSQGIRIETLDSLLSMLNLQAHPSTSSGSLECNPQTYSIYSQAWTYQQNEGSKITRTPSGSVPNISSYPTTGELYLPGAREKSSSFFLSGTEGRIVLYFTSSQVMRRTYDNCHEVRMIFRALQVLVDERNTNAVPEYTKELKNVLKKNFCLPQVFINGKYIGGVDVIREMNENGKLRSLAEGFPARNRPSYCDVCGELSVVSCPNCEYGKNCSECNDRNDQMPCLPIINHDAPHCLFRLCKQVDFRSSSNALGSSLKEM